MIKKKKKRLLAMHFVVLRSIEMKLGRVMRQMAKVCGQLFEVTTSKVNLSYRHNALPILV